MMPDAPGDGQSERALGSCKPLLGGSPRIVVDYAVTRKYFESLRREKLNSELRRLGDTRGEALLELGLDNLVEVGELRDGAVVKNLKLDEIRRHVRNDDTADARRDLRAQRTMNGKL